jgi:lipopolysaccharide/colanic/teichoic acid biosynthesis glycosyltransferase
MQANRKLYPDEELELYRYGKIKNDPRVTKLGKLLRATKLDELPQLFSILNGTMAFFGPRPRLESEFTSDVNRNRILSVKPGLIGYRQVRHADGHLNPIEKDSLDLYGIAEDNTSFRVLLIVATIIMIVTSIWS